MAADGDVLVTPSLYRDEYELTHQTPKYNDALVGSILNSELEHRFPRVGDKGRMVNVFRGLGERVFNPERLSLRTFNRMMRDATVAAIIKTIVSATVAGGFEISGGTTEQQDFFVRMFNDLDVNRYIEQALSALWVGYSVTEKVFDFVPYPVEDEDGNVSGTVNRHIFSRLKVLPPETLTFKMKPNGIITKVIQDGFMLGLGQTINFPPERVEIFTYNGGVVSNFGNPYGQSLLTPVYKNWFAKDHLIRYEGRYLELFAGGMLVGKSHGGNPDTMLKKLITAKSSSAMVLPDDQEVDFIFPPNVESGFSEARNYHDAQMAIGMLVPPTLLNQSGMSSSSGSRSLGEVHMDLFRIINVQRNQQMLHALFGNMIRQLTIMNWGEQFNYSQFIFKAWGVKQREELANFYLKMAKGGFIGENDIPFVRDSTELPPGDINTIGPRLIAGAPPDGSGSSGDAVTSGRDRGSGGDDSREDDSDSLTAELSAYDPSKEFQKELDADDPVKQLEKEIFDLLDVDAPIRKLDQWISK